MALLLAVLLHLGLAVLLVVGIDWREPVKPIGADVVVVQAQLVDQEKLDAEVSKRQAAERDKLEKAAAAERAEQEKAEALKERRAEEKRKLAELEQQKKQRKEEQARKAAEEKKKAEA
ncbi:MAG: hypothetical protein WBM63_16310, partial [Sedimenticolaceae bacterium]